MNRERQLIAKLLDAEYDEEIINELLSGIESGEFNKSEIISQIRAHSLLMSRQNENAQTDKIMKALGSFEKPSASISQKIINRLPSRRKSFWLSSRVAFAAILLLGCGLFFLYQKYSVNTAQSLIWKNSEYKLKKINHDEVSSELKMKNNYLLNNDEFSKIVSKDGLQISFQPQSSFYVENQKLFLSQGQLLAQIPKQNEGSKIEFYAGKSKTVITGTKFGISYFERNQQKEFLLELSEGGVNVFSEAIHESLKPNQYLYINETTGKYRKGEGLIEFENLLNQKIIHQAPKKYDWVPFFWEKWSPSQISMVENEKYLKLTGISGKTTTLTSRLIKTLSKEINYALKLRSITQDGKYEMGLKCYYKDKLSYMDSFEMTRKGNRCQIVIKKIRNGIASNEPSQTVEASSLRDFHLKGALTHTFRPIGDNREFTKSELENIQKLNPNRDISSVIDDLTFEIFVTCDENSMGSLLLTDIFVTH